MDYSEQGGVLRVSANPSATVDMAGSISSVVQRIVDTDHRSASRIFSNQQVSPVVRVGMISSLVRNCSSRVRNEE